MTDKANLLKTTNTFAIDLDNGKSVDVTESKDYKKEIVDIDITPLDDVSDNLTETDQAKIKELIRVT